MATPRGMVGPDGNRIDLSARLEEWRRLLLDTSKRSRLVSSKFGRGGILAIEHPDFYELWEQLAVKNQPAEFPWPSQWIDVDQVEEDESEADGQHRSAKGVLSAKQLQTIKESSALNTNGVLTNLTDRPLDGRLKRLAITASTSLSEQGVNSLFLAFGFLRWFESADSDVPMLSPLVLMPVSLRKQSADSIWGLAPVDDDLASNHPLTELLRSDFRLTLPQFTEDELWESSEALRSFFAEVERAIVDHERWQVQLTAGLGTFAFQKISMWQDLRKNEGQVTSHPLCRGIAGDSSLMTATDASDILNSDLDLAVSPETSYLVRDCDSSQLAAMEVVQQGHHLILDGPPGTGKSQTITNIIARCLANNKTVLFVSEKAAALEVVKRRLDEAKLGDFCLECHSHKSNKRAVVEELGRCLNRETETYPSQDHKITELRRTRQKLNDYVRALHVKRSALHLTAYGVHGRLARIRTSSATRVAIADTHSIDRNRLQEMEEAVARLASCGTIIAAKAIHPWRGCRTELYSLTLPDDIRFHFGRAATGLRKRLEAARVLENLGFLHPSPTRDDVAAAFEAASAVRSYPRVPKAWVEAGLAQTAERYIALQQLSKRHRSLCEAVVAYTGDAPAKADPSIMKLIVAGATRLQQRLPNLPTALRQQAAYLDSVDPQLQAVVHLAANLDHGLQFLQRTMGLPDTFASTIREAAKLIANALSIAHLGPTKTQWFDAAHRKHLHEVANAARQIALIVTPKLSELESKFLPAAFETGARSQLGNVHQPQVEGGFGKLDTWVRALPASLRNRAAYIGQIEAQLRALDRLATALDRTTHSLLEAASLHDRLVSSSRSADDLAANILAVISVGTVQPQWFDVTERNRLRKIATNAKQIASMAAAARSSLELKFLVTAFAPIARQQIDEVLRHRSWHKRLRGSWRLAKRNLCALYSVPAPEGSQEILDDAFQLARFHDYVDQLEKSVKRDGETLLWNGELAFDWDSVIGRLNAIEKLPTDFQNADIAKAVAVSPGSPSRAVVSAAAHQIRELFSQLSIAATAVAEILVVFEAFEFSDVCGLPPADLGARSRELAQCCQEHLTNLNTFFPFVAYEHDIDVADALQLKRLHEQIVGLGAITDGDREVLQWDGSLRFDWDAPIGRFDLIDQLPIELQNSESVRSIANSPDSKTRAIVISAAQNMRDIVDQLSIAVLSMSKFVALRGAFGITDCDEVSPSVLKERATELQNSCREHLACLRAVFPIIEDDQDVAVEDLANHFEVLVQLRGLTRQAETIASSLGDPLPDAPSRSIGDWQDRANLAEWVVAFLKQHAGSPPEHIIRGISDGAVRTELSAAVEKIKLADEPALQNSLVFVESLFSQTEEISTGIILVRAPITELIEWLAMRVRDADRISEWVSYTNACETLRRIGLQALRDEILDGHVLADEAVDVLRQRFYRLWLNEAYRDEPALGEFDLTQHDQTVGRFREVDRFLVKNGFAQVRSRILVNTARVAGSDGQAPDNSELGILLREVQKRKRHLPLRRLFASIPSLLPKLKPCMMMSPLAVSTYFDNSEIRFDVVIFDEASQVRPHDAICAIYRGSQLVVAGDQKQLPPTNFFERLGNDDDEDDELEHSSNDYESILDMCATLRMPRQRLKWHYRSKRESLIAFSNQHFYDGELVTFPSVRDVDGSSGVAFCFVENGRWAGRGAGGLNQAEAERIAEMVIRHASDRPDKSLGVITMNQAQQMHVIELIENRRRASLHLEQFFSNDKPDPFFVKNLENVQGDERDVIFLGVGYAKNDAGTLSHNFGPLNRQGGERRLNVAITRAREALTIFTSIRADDIDLSRTQARGAKLLRAYLDFAERGKVALASAETEDSEHDFDSDFEAEVARALTDHGLDVHRQIGCSGFRIDLALVDPAHPGRYVLGVECDGATYHSSATARDRDRLRQDVLESLGWKICRVWSTDWIRDPRRQIQKVLDAYQRALTATDPACSPTNEVEVLMPVKGVNQTAANDSHAPLQFSAIENVPADFLRLVLSDAITSYGAMPLEDLMQAAARKLGFQRTGSRIRDRLSYEVQNLERQGKLVTGNDGRLRLQNGNDLT